MGAADRKNDVIAHEWNTLKQLSQTVGSADVRQELANLLDDRFLSSESVWDRLNRAEQIVGMHLSMEQLVVEYDTLLGLGRDRKLSSLKTFKRYRNEYFRGAAPDEKKGRSAYIALLYALQSGFVEARFERKLRARTARQFLFLGGAGVLLVFLLLLLGRHRGGELWTTAAVTLVTVAAMGALGAFFSRIIKFQAKYSSLRFANLTSQYRFTTLLVRLLCGVIGALIFYFVMRSEVLTASVFPKWSVLDNGLPGEQLTEWSKVLVWSFVAGFSERLVPSSLERMGQDTEAK